MNSSQNGGFSNSATWIIFRDTFSNVIPYQIMGCDRKPSIDELSRAVRLVAVTQVFETSSEGFARECALGYLEDVNFYEIASVMFENYYADDQASRGAWIKDDDGEYEYIPSAAELS
jgi:hypothetical protein